MSQEPAAGLPAHLLSACCHHCWGDCPGSNPGSGPGGLLSLLVPHGCCAYVGLQVLASSPHHGCSLLCTNYVPFLLVMLSLQQYNPHAAIPLGCHSIDAERCGLYFLSCCRGRLGRMPVSTSSRAHAAYCYSDLQLYIRIKPPSSVPLCGTTVHV